VGHHQQAELCVVGNSLIWWSRTEHHHGSGS